MNINCVKDKKAVNKQDAAKAARYEYHKRWQRENRERVKSYQERYWMKRVKQLDKEADQAEAANA